MRIRGRRCDTGEPVELDVAGQAITSARPLSPSEAPGLPWLAPGLIDVQANGYGGQEFSSADLTVDKVVGISSAMWSFGVTGYCPTLTTENLDVIEHGLRTIHAACEQSPETARQVIGIHLEGPYLSMEDGPRGAHPLQHCRRPDWDEFRRLQDASGGRIRLHTLAVEFEEAPEYIGRVVDSGVVVAIGHTAADSDDIRRAVDAGARMSTHLGNGCHRLIHRHSSYIWDQLAEDRLAAGLIADGHHLPPPVLKTFIRAKTPERCILVSDMSGQAGQPPGRYHSDFCDVEILPTGRLVVAGQREMLAGASSPIGDGVANAMHFAGLDLATAVGMATSQPARLLGAQTGGMQPGDPADLVLFDLATEADPRGPARLEVRATIKEGKTVFGATG